MKIFIDDIRDVPDESWTLCRTITEAIRTINRFDDIECISLDHDISHDVRIDGVYRPFPCEENYTAVAYYIGEKYVNDLDNDVPPKVILHTANPVGAEMMKAILKGYSIPCEIKPMGPAFRQK